MLSQTSHYFTSGSPAETLNANLTSTPASSAFPGQHAQKKRKTSHEALVHAPSRITCEGLLPGDELPDEASIFPWMTCDERTSRHNLNSLQGCLRTNDQISVLGSIGSKTGPQPSSGPMKVLIGAKGRTSASPDEFPRMNATMLTSSRLPISTDKQSAPRQPALPRLPTKTRLTRFLHFSRSDSRQTLEKGEEDIQNVSSRGDDFHIRTGQRMELRDKLLSRPKATEVRWEQHTSLWAPGFEGARPHGSLSVGLPQPTCIPSASDLEASHGRSPKASTTQTQQVGHKPCDGHTQLEQQWLGFKKQHPNLILLMEVGYKVSSFGVVIFIFNVWYLC